MAAPGIADPPGECRHWPGNRTETAAAQLRRSLSAACGKGCGTAQDGPHPFRRGSRGSEVGQPVLHGLPKVEGRELGCVEAGGQRQDLLAVEGEVAEGGCLLYTSDAADEL